jgi:hypothetical protein
MGNSRSRNIEIDQDRLISTDSETQMVQTATLKPPIHIRKDTLKITDNQYITFIYDSYTDVSINSYYFAIEALKAHGKTECYYIDLEKYPNPSEFKLAGGINQNFPDHLIQFNFSNYTLSELTFSEKKIYPLIIEIVKHI